jgi:hypothetical protein
MGRKGRFSTFPVPAVRKDRDVDPVPPDLASPPDPERASLIASIVAAGALAVVLSVLAVYGLSTITP